VTIRLFYNPCQAGHVKAITIRNIPPDLARLIRHRAMAERTSLNRTVIHLLEESMGGAEKTSPEGLHHDLDELAGSWTAEEAAAFDAALASQRRIDSELWK
jgi:hypothetical protein